eukprot:TRINITY_DN65419_c7_g6_i1.p1 TRINITY_DN65419_c7_g6~~TRINITY_DN65419_c7_g6_i1.p1  ORF type:complete len:656 (-),score=345.97 TRINITY_DN65419_c7_g6_i1:902-2869(-)
MSDDDAAIAKALKDGHLFVKHGKRGRPHERLVFCTEDLAQVCWGKDSGRRAASADIVAVKKGFQTEVFERLKQQEAKAIEGRQQKKQRKKKTKKKGKKKQSQSQRGNDDDDGNDDDGDDNKDGKDNDDDDEEEERKKVQIVSASNRVFSIVFESRTLDLECGSEAERDEWFARFEWLREAKSQRQVGMPYNVKHTAHVNRDFEWTGQSLEQDFELVARLGQGAFGEVYHARHKQSGFELAIKLIPVDVTDDSSIEEIRHEVNILKKCKNSGIVNYFGCWGPDSEDRLWIMMELCSGGSLLDMLEAKDDDGEYAYELTEDQISYIGTSVLRSLLYLHTQKVVHRDVKSGNILLTNKGEIKVTDFGISKLVEDENQKKFSMPAGSPLWMAPEIIMGKRGTYKADVWSLGITLIELAEGDPPWSNMSGLRAMAQITRAPPPTLSEPATWSKDFVDFIAKCLVKDPEQRPSTMELVMHPFVNRQLTKDIILPIIGNADDEQRDGSSGKIISWIKSNISSSTPERSRRRRSTQPDAKQHGKNNNDNRKQKQQPSKSVTPTVHEEDSETSFAGGDTMVRQGGGGSRVVVDGGGSRRQFGSDDEEDLPDWLADDADATGTVRANKDTRRRRADLKQPLLSSKDEKDDFDKEDTCCETYCTIL